MTERHKMDTIKVNPHHITDIRSLEINGIRADSFVNPANITYVSKDGNDETGNGSYGNPFLTIGAGNDYAIANKPSYPQRGMVKVLPGIYEDEHITQAHYRIHICGNTRNLDHRERDVILANTGVDADHYPLGMPKALNLNGITVATMDETYYSYVPGVFGTLTPTTQFSNCTFRGGYFIEQETADASNVVMNFDRCFFNGDAFKIDNVSRDYRRFIALRHCDLYNGNIIFESYSAGDNSKVLKFENSMLGSDSQIKGDWSLLCQWSELYSDGKITFDTDGAVDIFSSIIVNGIHFTTDTPETKKLVNCLFRDIPSGVGDVTADESVEFIEYSGNHQCNGIDGEIITVSKIKNVAGGQNMYRSIHEALQGSTLQDTIINLEGDVDVDVPLVVPPNIAIQIDGNNKWFIHSTTAANLVELGDNQDLSFVGLRHICGGKKAIINGNSAALAFVDCGNYLDPCHVNIEINAGDISSSVYLLNAVLIGTAAPAITINDVDPWLIIDKSFVKGASGEAAIEWNVDADSRFRGKYCTLLHGSGAGNSPFSNTTTTPTEDINFSLYNSSLNASYAANEFTNTISAQPNISVDSDIDY